jgi:lysozyme
MPPIVPPKVPQISREQTLAFLTAAGLPNIDRAVLLGRRGFFIEMGDAGNDFGVYDDGIVLISPTAFVTYNANTDPSVKKPKVAVLQPGRWTYELGTHNRNKPVELQYRALIQAREVVVFRPDTESVANGSNDPSMGSCLGEGKWRGWFGVNIHRGGFTTTGSEGCQTIYKPQWDAFLAQTEMEMKRYAQKTIDYYLTAEAA